MEFCPKDKTRYYIITFGKIYSFFLYQGELDGLVEEEGEYNQQREDEVDGFVKVHIALYI